MLGLLNRFLRNKYGGVAIYTAYAGTLLIGACALGIDIGRLSVLRTQMQNAADSAALAAAAQLDGKANARARAEAVARNAVSQISGLLPGGEIVVDQVWFYRDANWNSAFTDFDTRAVYITLQPGQTELLFQPVLSIISGGAEFDAASLTARAAAVNSPVTCMPVPLIVCLGPSASTVWSLTNPANAGRQAVFHEYYDAGSGHVATFRFVCPPDDPGCDEATAFDYATATSTDQCVTNPDHQVDVSEATVDDAINIRFGDTADSADDVIYYDRDTLQWQEGDDLTVGAYSDGDWPLAEYWEAKHGDGDPATNELPAALDDAAGTSRYQVYLYELGQTFAKKGRQTYFPVPDPLPPGFTVVSSPGVDLPEDDSDHQNEAVDGFPDDSDTAGPDPQPPAGTTDPMRRVITAGIGDCGDLGGFRWAQGYVRLFLTERAIGYSIYSEIIGPLDSAHDPNFVANSRLFY